MGDGLGTAVWTNTSALSVGGNGTGTLNINAGGLVSTLGLLGGNAASGVNFDAGTLRITTQNTNNTSNAMTLLHGGGTIDIPSAAATFTVNSAMSGPGGLIKTGSGMMELAGANLYAGGTTVNSGTLLINNTSGSGTGSGPVSVAVGATLDGGGSITGDVTIDGSLSPGNSPGVFSQGALTFNEGSFFVYDVDSSSRTADLVNVDGELSINQLTTLSLSDPMNAVLGMGTKFTIVNYLGTWNGGAFDGIPQGSSFMLGVNKFQIFYDDISGGSNFGGGSFGAGSRYVTITVVPEPDLHLAIAVCGLLGTTAARLRHGSRIRR